MKLELETSSYNQRKYGKPYIATLDFATDPKGMATWGTWVGNPGDSGVLVIDCGHGDIIMRGQKDFRGAAHKSAPDYFVLAQNGTLEPLENKAAAYKLFREREKSAASVVAE